jgi:hypothetical protein
MVVGRQTGVPWHGLERQLFRQWEYFTPLWHERY